MWLGQQCPPAEDRTLCPPSSLCHCRKAGSGERGWCPSPLGPISHIGFWALINWLHLPHIWQARFLITLWSLQRTWITGMRGALVTSPHSVLPKVPHISRGQALAWARAEPGTRAMALRHCHGAQRFSLRGRTDNFEPRQHAAFFSCQSYLVCIQIEKMCEILPQESVQKIRGGGVGVERGWERKKCGLQMSEGYMPPQHRFLCQAGTLWGQTDWIGIVRDASVFQRQLFLLQYN